VCGQFRRRVGRAGEYDQRLPFGADHRLPVVRVVLSAICDVTHR
jgi:hypothetical protein